MTLAKDFLLFLVEKGEEKSVLQNAKLRMCTHAKQTILHACIHSTTSYKQPIKSVHNIEYTVNSFTYGLSSLLSLSHLIIKMCRNGHTLIKSVHKLNFLFKQEIL